MSLWQRVCACLKYCARTSSKMLRLFHYFRKKPSRFFYTVVLLFVVGAAVYGILSLSFQAEIFAKLVANPDHRMQRDDKHFNGLNSDNIRSMHEALSMRDDDFNIIFLGDSFIYGFLLSPEQSPPAQLEKILREQYRRDNINVINFGWTSSSPYLSYRLLQDLGARYKPDLVLLAVDMSDYRDEWFYKSVLEDRGYYRHIKQFPRAAFYLKRVMEFIEPVIDLHTPIWGYAGKGGYFVAEQPMEKSLNLFDDIYNTLLQINDYSRNTLNSPFVVFVPPRHWQYTDKESPDSWENGGFDTMGPYALENYRYFDGKMGVAPFPIINMVDDFRKTEEFPLNFRVDSHWNKKGARFFAGKVAEQIKNQDLVH
jgi:hypothetical protein